jgi:GT2 family glycosyltransferase
VSESPRISVVIATLRRPVFLRHTLESLRHADPAPDEIVIVDGDPERSALPVVEAYGGAAATPPALYEQDSGGPSRQRNVGVDYSSGDVIVIADDDIAVEPDVFGRLVRAYAVPAVVGATGRVIEPETRRFGKEQSAARLVLFSRGQEGAFTRFGYPRYVQHVDRELDIEMMSSCFLSARRDAYQRVRFDETITGTAAEDQDFSYRLSRLGRVRYLPDVIVYHRKRGFTSQDRRTFDREMLEHRLRLFRKNFPQTPLARLEFALFVGVLLVHRLVNGELDAARGLLEGSWRLLRR